MNKKPIYACKKCGRELFDERIPIEHGAMSIRVAGVIYKGKQSIQCKGNFTKIFPHEVCNDSV